ncbi:MAG: restriction endonuclease subunit S [Corynebacterium sp.]|uniref:restriction endonuclease subunit S n=1 Tax=Corynebacterium sp. TaxID=1720 RepID=UPI0026E053F8|nr:restriction endonuclease subunit S [Corynebacterium sp.]MDO5669964.1 restriction endonuclease subunit S [Corynebacterium sp.]
MFPRNWNLRTVEDLCLRITSGGTPKRSNPNYYEPGTIPWIKTADLNDAYIHQYSEYISEAGLRESSAKLLPANTVLMAMYGATVGMLGMLTEEATCNQASCALIADPAVCDHRWLFYALLNDRDFIISQATGAAQQNLSGKTIRQFQYPTPPLKEQQAIAEVLGALDDKIATNIKLGRSVEDLGAAHFSGLGLDVEPAGEGISLDSLFDFNPRRTVSSENPTIIAMKDLPTATPLVEEWTTGSRKGGARFKNGDTLIARITPCLENRKTAFVDFLGDGEVGIGSTEFIVMRSKNNLPLGVSYFMAISERFRDFAIQNLIGTSGRQRVSAADLARHTISPVDATKLQEFGSWADDNLAFLGTLREENRTLAEIRDALLPPLMSGKLRVKDAEKVVEDAV